MLYQRNKTIESNPFCFKSSVFDIKTWSITKMICELYRSVRCEQENEAKLHVEGSCTFWTYTATRSTLLLHSICLGKEACLLPPYRVFVLWVFLVGSAILLLWGPHCHGTHKHCLVGQRHPFLACRSRQASIVLERYFRFEVSLLSFYACERDGPIWVSGGSDIIT